MIIASPYEKARQRQRVDGRSNLTIPDLLGTSSDRREELPVALL
jgi:hypothetical protein